MVYFWTIADKIWPQEEYFLASRWVCYQLISFFGNIIYFFVIRKVLQMTKDEIVELFSQDGMAGSIKNGLRPKSIGENEGGSKDDGY